MKMFWNICVLTCLLGFGFSTFQYVLLKAGPQKMELKKLSDCKKETETENEKDSREKDDETGTDNELSDLVQQFSELEWRIFYQSSLSYHRSEVSYYCSLAKIPTPPPEV